jgi:hypothetical protein
MIRSVLNEATTLLRLYTLKIRHRTRHHMKQVYDENTDNRIHRSNVVSANSFVQTIIYRNYHDITLKVR